MRRLVIGAVFALAVAATVASAMAFAGQPSAGEARNAIANLLGAKRDEVRIVSLSPGLVGGDAVVVAQMNVPFQLHQDKSGDWRVASVRLHDGRWEDVEMLQRALDAEKTARARTDLSALAAGIEAFRRDRGYYPDVDSCAALVDLITPAYLPMVIRQDPWNRPYAYRGSSSGFELASYGPDGKPNSGDDVAFRSSGSGTAR